MAPKQAAAMPSENEGYSESEYSRFDKTAFDAEDDPESSERAHARMLLDRKPIATARATNADEGPAAPRRGLDLGSAPLESLPEVFGEMANRAVAAGLREKINHVGTRPITVVTMCSGTESPILALASLAQALERDHKLRLSFEHLFSVEIVPFKQAYIERNFAPKTIFRDVTEVAGNEEATDAYGATIEVPKEPVDLLIAGPSCVDFSPLNNKKVTTLEARAGESSRTAHAVIAYADKRRPRLIIIENVEGAPWGQIVKHLEARGYAATWMKCDSKDYYLPQTRSRGYLFAIDCRGKTLTSFKLRLERWQGLMSAKFKRPATSSIESFVLPDDDPKVLRAKEDICRGGLGDDQSRKEANWTACQGRYLDYRTSNELGSKRPMTLWESGGYCRGPDFMWHLWLRKQVDRIKDTMDIGLLRCAAKGFDPQFKTRVWELSQNVDRFTDNAAFGITGCLTPSGMPYITNRGGPLLGIEALALQGLPVDELNLTKETNAQLRDLAGNAMTSTVVGSAILAALIAAGKLLDEDDERRTMTIDEEPAKPRVQTSFLVVNRKDWVWVQRMSLTSILDIAKAGARYCICEGQHLVARSQMFECTKCGQISCNDCKGNPTHSFDQPMSLRRVAPRQAATELKASVPMIVKLSDAMNMFRMLKSNVHNITNKLQKQRDVITKLVGEGNEQVLFFQSIKRGASWTVTYESEYTRLEMVINRDHVQYYLFVKVPKSLPSNSVLRKNLEHPVARMTASSDLISGEWELFVPEPVDFKVHIKSDPNEQVPAWQSRLGLEADALRQKKMPKTLELTVSSESQIESETLEHIVGKYSYLPDCGTACSGLFRRDAASESGVPTFFFLDPTRDEDPSNDGYVFSTTKQRLGYKEYRPIIAYVKRKPWRPSEKSVDESINCVVQGTWEKSPSMELSAPQQNGRMKSSHIAQDLATKLDCYQYSGILQLTFQEPQIANHLNYDWETVKPSEWPLVLNTLSHLLENLRGDVEFAKWHHISQSQDQDCLCIPKAPELIWSRNEKKTTQFIVKEDPRDAAEYERLFKERPHPFLIQRIFHYGSLVGIRFSINPAAIAHRAEAHFPKFGAYLEASESYHSALGSHKYSWRMCVNFVDPLHFSAKKFKLLSNKGGSQARQPPRFQENKTLRDEQLRSLAWMLEREKTLSRYTEEEIEEAVLLQMGWRLEGRHTREVRVRGGVLADHVGYGKTITTLGVIASNPLTVEDQYHPSYKQAAPGGYRMRSKATLVLVPSHLTGQWTAEAKSFMKSDTKIITITDVNVLKRLPIKTIQNADIIICSLGLFGSKPYWERSSQLGAIRPHDMKGPLRRTEFWLNACLEEMTTLCQESHESSFNELLALLKDMHLHRAEEEAKYKSFEPSKRNKKTLAPKATKEPVSSTRADDDDADEIAKSLNGDKKRKSTHVHDDADDQPPLQKRKTGFPKQRAVASKRKTKTTESDEPNGFLDKDFCNLNKHHGTFVDVKGPSLHLFHFHRLVVDEFQQLEPLHKLFITKLDASIKWMISGTPPLSDFADVKGIATLLGVHLGKDEVSPLAMKARNAKAIQKYQTDVEAFNSFQSLKTVTWHMHRAEVAQKFLNFFVRQNTAEVDEIPLKQHIIGVSLTRAEHILYTELQQHLLGSSLFIKRNNKTPKNDREVRLNETLKDSSTAREALLKCCSYFDSEWKRGEAPLDAIIETRMRQRVEVLIDLERCLKIAKAENDRLIGIRGFSDEKFLSWISHVDNNKFGDIASRLHARDRIEFVFGGRKHWRKLVPIGKPIEKVVQPRRQVSAEEAEIEKAMRLHVIQLRSIMNELVLRTRSLRFLVSIKKAQQVHSAMNSEYDAVPKLICRGCWNSDDLMWDVRILGRCGHTICQLCYDESLFVGTCPAKECEAELRQVYAYKASSFGMSEDAIPESAEFGAKFERLRYLIQDEEQIGADEQVILFVQFRSMIAKISQALKKVRIPHIFLEAEKGQSTQLEKFKKSKASEYKVLLLNVDDGTATGSNLVNANHVIFYAPIVKGSRDEYEAVMTQAIGRARRHGQQKTVHSYHLLSLNTIDVDTLEDRTGRTLVKNGDDFELRSSRATGSFRSDLDAQLVANQMRVSEVLGDDDGSDVEGGNKGEEQEEDDAAEDEFENFQEYGMEDVANGEDSNQMGEEADEEDPTSAAPISYEY